MNSMLFLAKFSFGDLVGDLKLIVVGMIRQLFYTICSAVYMMITYIYNIFIMLCNGQLLRPSEINELFSRVGVLLGIIMILRVILSFIQSLVDPNSAFDGKKGIPGVVKKVVIVIVMFGVSSYIFSVAREIQVLVIDKEVIPNLILPVKVDTTNFGGALSANLFTAFYNLNSDLKKPENKDELDLVNSTNCGEEYIKNLQKSIANNNDFSYMDDICVAETVVYKSKFGDGSSTKDFVIDFNFIFCLLVGVMVLWYLLNYCIQVGMRIIQLTMLQVISPMAFISYLSPKDENMFSKWLKLYTSTYIDVFIRIAVIDFVCYLSALIMTEWNSGEGVFWTSVSNPSGMVRTITGIIMIIALFTFAKKAPELIKTLFPTGAAGSALGFGTSDTKGGIGAVGAATIGGIAGGFTSATARFSANERKGALAAFGGFASGLVSGAVRGQINGLRGGMKNIPSNISKQRELDNKYYDLVRHGGSIPGAMMSKIGDFFGSTEGQAADLVESNLNQLKEFKKSMNSDADQISFVADAKSALQNMQQRDGETYEEFINRKATAQNLYRGLRNAAAQAASEGRNDLTNFTYKGLDTDRNSATYGQMIDKSFDVTGYSIAGNDDDMAYASSIRSTIVRAESFRKTNNIHYWDENNQTYVKSTPITDRDSLSKVEAASNSTIAHINTVSRERAKANDEYAGVNKNKKH